MTTFQLKEYIHKSVGIPPHSQRLMISEKEVDRNGQAVRELLPSACEGPVEEPPEIGLIIREYHRQEMQAAARIEGVWKRRRPTLARREREQEAATRIASFIRR